jgi:stearoyl-CoA desaturase (delta-9 desaturase)
MKAANKGSKITVVNEGLERRKLYHAWAFILIPAVGFVTAMALIPVWGMSLWEIGLLFGMYLVTFIGVEVGVHRLFSHKSFETTPLVRWILAILGSMEAQGPLIYTVSIHRRHHMFSDKEQDPHSPYLHHRGFWNKLRGLWHAHIGWAFDHEIPNTSYFAKDLLGEPLALKVNRLYLVWVLIGLVIPAVLGGIIMGTWMGAFRGFLWGGLVRIFLVQQAVCSVNSFGHYFGRRPFDARDRSANNFWLSIPTFGQAWQNNHHAFPSSPQTGFKWWEIDLAGGIIRIMESLGLAWDLKIPTGRMLEEKKAH